MSYFNSSLNGMEQISWVLNGVFHFGQVIWNEIQILLLADGRLLHIFLHLLLTVVVFFQ